MARPKKAIRPVEKNISIDQDIATRIDLHLYSDLEGRVPHGAWSKLLNPLLRNFIETLPPATEQKSLEDLIK